jgi:hypothetical protein
MWNCEWRFSFRNGSAAFICLHVEQDDTMIGQDGNGVASISAAAALLSALRLLPQLHLTQTLQRSKAPNARLISRLRLGCYPSPTMHGPHDSSFVFSFASYYLRSTIINYNLEKRGSILPSETQSSRMSLPEANVAPATDVDWTTLPLIIYINTNALYFFWK